MITVSIFGIILTVAVSAASFMFAIVQSIRLQNEQQLRKSLRNELIEYGMFDEFRKRRYESFGKFIEECKQSNSSGD